MTAGLNIAILDDYQNVALRSADWSPLAGIANIVVFTDTLSEERELTSRLAPFDVLCVMRERTPLTLSVMRGLPKLGLIASTGPRNASIDMIAAGTLGIEVMHTRYLPSPAVELTWSLILAYARNIIQESASVRHGGWQVGLARGLAGAKLGLLGLGNLGTAVSAVGNALGMDVIAWSPNLTEDKASAAGARSVSKEALFREADYLSVHLVLSEQTRGIVGKNELSVMKPNALLVNTSRGPLVDETALIEALRSNRIGGAALDAYDVEPLPADHPYRTLPNVLATPHVGYVTDKQYEIFFGDTVANILSWNARRTS